MGGNPVIDQHPIQGGVEILLVTSCYRDRDRLWPDEPLGSYADFTFPTLPACLLKLYRSFRSTLLQLLSMDIRCLRFGQVQFLVFYHQGN